MMRTDVSHAPPESPAQRSPWHSPVPYLFGGLAAMLGLIAIALLILACSYWKLFGCVAAGDNSSVERDLELGTSDEDKKLKIPQVIEEKFLVIMAGQEKPTFLATPISSRASSFGSHSSSSSEMTSEKSEDVRSEKSKEEIGDQVQTLRIVTRETSDHIP
ncbi:Protein GLUTAMINE DUMPER 3 like [Actinidia chinensis var. chinensis]|uniref:Protein GLUTAMINE DUMPER 3 like n=1 Tax=Actinidia chinensis var. chinensis TaxID=1590841 RepID=A0A2R6QHX5_ACTCC|nr:Protein GLUTAMINE DUMPER 3 like [Actinidia chinensis var. chinensis]